MDHGGKTYWFASCRRPYPLLGGASRRELLGIFTEKTPMGLL